MPGHKHGHGNKHSHSTPITLALTNSSQNHHSYHNHQQRLDDSSRKKNWDEKREEFLQEAQELLGFRNNIVASFFSDKDLKTKLAHIDICICFYNAYKFAPSMDDQEIYRQLTGLKQQVETKIKDIEHQQMLPTYQAAADRAETDIIAKLQAAKQLLIQGKLRSARKLIVEVKNIVSDYKLHVDLFKNIDLGSELKKCLYVDAITRIDDNINNDEQICFRLANKILNDALSSVSKKSDETLLARHKQTLIQAMGRALVKNQHKFYKQDQKALRAAMTILISKDLNEVSSAKKFARNFQVLGSWDTWDLKHSKALPHMLAWMIETQPLTTIPTFTIALFPNLQIPCLDSTEFAIESEIDYDWHSKIPDLQEALDRWDPLLRDDKSKDSQEIIKEKQVLLQWQYRRIATSAPQLYPAHVVRAAIAPSEPQLYPAHEVEQLSLPLVLDAIVVEDHELGPKTTSEINSLTM